MKTIAFDLDDVLLRHFEGLIAWYNREYGTTVPLATNHSYDVTPWGTSSIPEAVERIHRYFETDEFKAESPYEGAAEAIALLKERFNLVVVTGRDTFLEKITFAWIAKHFPGTFNEVHLTAQYSLDGDTRSKVDVLKELKADYYIDDFLGTVTEVAEAGIKTILFGDWPWNQTETLPEGVVRCADWPAVLEYFSDK